MATDETTETQRLVSASGRRIAAAACLAMTAACTTVAPDRDTARAQVLATERAFAQTMARRDLAAFTGFLSDEAVFFTGPTALRGRAQVAEGWARFFKAPAAPFSWEPDTVEALDSGTLALSSGPVRDPKGKLIGRFNSIWRLEPDGWRIVFDKGEDACDCR